MVENIIGIRPLALPEGTRDRRTSGVSSAWLRANFNDCTPAAALEVVERYARVWLWHLFAVSFSPMGQATQFLG